MLRVRLPVSIAVLTLLAACASSGSTGFSAEDSGVPEGGAPVGEGGPDASTGDGGKGGAGSGHADAGAGNGSDAGGSNSNGADSGSGDTGGVGGGDGGDGGSPSETDGGSQPGTDAGGGGSCGGATCYAGQTCVAGQCTSSCTGSTVPGDYATVQDAVYALQNVGGTICLGAQTFDEAVTATVTKPLTIQGVSPQQSKVTGLTLVCDSTCNVQGLTLGSLAATTDDDHGTNEVTLTQCAITGTSATPTGVSIDLTAQQQTFSVTIDGCDLTAPASGGGSAIAVAQGPDDYFATLNVTVENSYVHDAPTGLFFNDGSDNAGSATLVLLNDTFRGNTGALDVVASPSLASNATVGIQYFNDLFVGNGLGVELIGLTSMQGGANAYYGNTTNFAGSAVHGPGDLTSDPMLDGATPPGLQPGSPCIGAGDPAHAPAHDYFGRPRGASIDIGAVQSP